MRNNIQRGLGLVEADLEAFARAQDRWAERLYIAIRGAHCCLVDAEQ